MSEVTINFNNENFIAIYNEQTGYYELELTAPDAGGVYEVDVTFRDSSNGLYYSNKKIQVLAKEEIKVETNQTFMWIFDYKDFEIKDIVELSDYEFNIDEETNATSVIKIVKETSAKAKDIIVIKKNREIVYWGVIQKIDNTDGENLYQYTIDYITNMFDRKIELEDEELIKNTGIEDFIANAIDKNFINSDDEFINKSYIKINILTHTVKQVSVTNVDNNIYNLHTYMTNCTQNYDIVYEFETDTESLIINISCKEQEEKLIDVRAQAVSSYSEVFSTSYTSKVTVLTSEDKPYTLYLLTDRTTTTDMTNEDRADGEITTTYTEKYEDAEQTALDVMKSNSYNHNVTFNFNEYIKVGTPVCIKTKKSTILDTYISAVVISNNNFYTYTCGNIRTTLLDKLLKERKN